MCMVKLLVFMFGTSLRDLFLICTSWAVAIAQLLEHGLPTYPDGLGLNPVGSKALHPIYFPFQL